MSDLYYDAKYFEWQKQIGEIGGKVNLFKFEKYIGRDSDVLDFGCGGGYLLKNMNTCGKKIGIDINPIARKMAEENGIICFDDIRKVEDDSIDVLISNHALEHVDCPINYIKEFRRVVRNKGKIVLVVPHEITEQLNPCDRNMELHTWSPQNMYNLLTICKIDTICCERLSYAWLPSDWKIQEKDGWEEFHRVSKLRAEEENIYQTVAVGVVLKETNSLDDKFIRSDDGIYTKYCNKMMKEWENIEEIIKKNKKIAIYGAGTIGKRISRFLTEKEHVVDCFVVSNSNGNEADVNGLHVVPIDKLEKYENYIFILGISNQKTKENICQNLRSIGCSDIIDFNIGIIDCFELGMNC